MAIFPARCTGFLPRKRARPARRTTAAIALAGTSSAENARFTLGPDFAQPLAQVEIEKIARWHTQGQHSAIPSRAEPSLLDGGCFAVLAAGYRHFKPLRASGCGARSRDWHTPGIPPTGKGHEPHDL
jgi:hypothetical protein